MVFRGQTCRRQHHELLYRYTSDSSGDHGLRSRLNWAKVSQTFGLCIYGSLSRTNPESIHRRRTPLHMHAHTHINLRLVGDALLLPSCRHKRLLASSRACIRAVTILLSLSYSLPSRRAGRWVYDWLDHRNSGAKYLPHAQKQWDQTAVRRRQPGSSNSRRGTPSGCRPPNPQGGKWAKKERPPVSGSEGLEAACPDGKLRPRYWASSL